MLPDLTRKPEQRNEARIAIARRILAERSLTTPESGRETPGWLPGPLERGRLAGRTPRAGAVSPLACDRGTGPIPKRLAAWITDIAQ